MCNYNISSFISFFLKKNILFSLERANKRKKNLILPLEFNKVENRYSQNEPIPPFIMQIKPVYHLFVYLTALSLIACTSDEMVLTVGEGVMNDDHKAFYTENFTIESETLLAPYVSTNNTGVAMCGSYLDDYIGEITTNTVFKISPHVPVNNGTFDITATYDSMCFVMFPNNYIYGDSTQVVNYTLHQLTENYEIDTLYQLIDGNGSVTYHKTNNSTTAFDPSVIANISFTPANTDSVFVRLSDIIGQDWFNKILADDDDFTIKEGEDDSKFIENVLPGLTVRSVAGNNAVLGFNMPTTDNTGVRAGMTIRMYYHTTGPYTERYHDFKIYSPRLQYNQITADFSKGLLDGIQPGGDGIPSSQTNGLTFIQSGLGLMTNIEIPTLYELFLFGKNLTIIDLDLDFKAKPYSFDGDYPIPPAMTMHKLRKNGQINPNGLLDFSDAQVGVSQTKLSKSEAEFSVPITRYGWEEQDLLGPEVPEHNSLLITARYNGAFIPNINRMVIGDDENRDCKMEVKMYFTIFE